VTSARAVHFTLLPEASAMLGPRAPHPAATPASAGSRALRQPWASLTLVLSQHHLGRGSRVWAGKVGAPALRSHSNVSAGQPRVRAGGARDLLGDS
jgi:hypothetical protein